MLGGKGNPCAGQPIAWPAIHSQCHWLIEVRSLKGMAANRDVESIKLNTKLGNCSLKVSAQLQESDEAKKLLGEYAMAYLIWHVIPAAAFNKKSDFSRDSKFSDELAAHLKNETKAVLNKAFSDVSIETSEHVKADPIEKLMKQYDVDRETAELFLAKSKKANVKAEAEQSTDVESV